MNTNNRYSIRTDRETSIGLLTAYENDRQMMLDNGGRPRSLNSFIVELIRRGLIDIHVTNREGTK